MLSAEPKARRRAEHGMTVVELLVSLALTLMVLSVVTSVLFSVLTSHRQLLKQTDQYESLRIAATMIMRDARFAALCETMSSGTSLQLSRSPTDYVIYKFASDNAGAEQPDNRHLHRWAYSGGVFRGEEIVGWHLVPPEWGVVSGVTAFGCVSELTPPFQRHASVRLVKPPLPGQASGAELLVKAFQRIR